MPTNVLVLNKSWMVTGAGNPEGAQSGPVGSIFLREDGSAGTSVYIKETGAGNTGWTALGAGTQGPPGDPGLVSGRTFYFSTAASDIATYKTMAAVPSAGAEQTIGVSCSGTSDVLVAVFATDPGVPGAGPYPAGTGYRRIFARTSTGTARLHMQVYVRAQGGTETLVRDEFSDGFTNQTVALVSWMATAPDGGTVLATDRLVVKLYAQRVVGNQPLTVTVHFEGTTHASQVQTTLVVPVASRPGVIGYTFDGGGAVITTGVKGFLEISVPCTITGVTLLSTDAAATAGSLVVDLWKAPYANYPPTVANTITASARPTLSSANKSKDTTLTGWTTAIAAGDILGFNVVSASLVTKVALTLTVSV